MCTHQYKKDRHKNRGGLNKIDLSGKSIGNLLVLHDTGRRKSRRPIWHCKCSCGKEVEILSKYLLNGDTVSCGCITQGNAHNRDAVGKISLSYWTPIVKQAKRRGIPLTIDRQYAWDLFCQQDGKCAISGVTIDFATNMRDERLTHTASLDRIQNSKGYVEGNVQWVHKKINIMKNVMTREELLEWCERIVLMASGRSGELR